MPLGVEHFCREVARMAKYGLFHGVPIRHGFQVSKRGKNKTKRSWKPNVQSVLLYSEALDRRIRLTVTTTALRQIDFHGGLDNYLVNVPERFRRSDVAIKLREEILAKQPEPPKIEKQVTEKTESIEKEKRVEERFYIEKVLKPGGRVAYEMVSELTGQRLDKKTKEEVIPDENQEEIKYIPQPKPVDIHELRKKYLGDEA